MPRVLGTAKILKKGLITIPKQVREQFNLQEGDIILFISEDGKLIIKKAEPT